MRNIKFNNLSRKNKNISIRLNKRLSDYLRTVKTSLDKENLNRSFERNKPTSKGGYLKPYVVLRSIDK